MKNKKKYNFFEKIFGFENFSKFSYKWNLINSQLYTKDLSIDYSTCKKKQKI